tara:strand:+ start:7679 stop:8488 length:810 start_codon:yes stop_codon:yes gene_type:complete
MSDYDMSEYEKALDEFFDIKTKYEEAHQRKKGNIINSDSLSKKEKRKAIESLKMKCIGCNRKVNTLFYDKDRMYGAICGDTENPCTLNIQLKKPSTMNIKEVLPTIENDIQMNERNIKKIKLYLLFGLIDSDETIELYTQEKDSYVSNVEFKQQLTEYLNDTMNVEFREDEIKQLNENIQTYIKNIKENMNDYMINGNKEALDIVMEIYSEYLLKDIDNLRKNKYIYSEIEEIIKKQDELPEMHINQYKNLTSNFEMIHEEGEIVSFKK